MLDACFRASVEEEGYGEFFLGATIVVPEYFRMLRTLI